MKINKKCIILTSLSVVFSANSWAQTAQVITNPQTNSTQLVIPINPNIALQSPWIMNNAKNLEQLNKKTPTNDEVKVDKNTKEQEEAKAAKEKLEKDKIEADASKKEVAAPVVNTKPAVAKPMGQVVIYNPVIVTNDIRLWNTTSITEKQEEGKAQMMESYRNRNK